MHSASTIISIPGRLRVTLCDAKFFTEKEFSKATDALCVLSYVLNSDEFYDRLMSETFTTTKLSNSTIYDIITLSDEKITAVEGTFGMDFDDEDHEMDLVLSMYSSRFSKVLGYTFPESVRIFINRKFFTRLKPWQAAGNFFHEHCHNLGFDHSSASDANSVPYKLGNIVAELGEKNFSRALSTRRALLETSIYTGSMK